jgi:hypothetical protein
LKVQSPLSPDFTTGTATLDPDLEAKVTFPSANVSVSLNCFSPLVCAIWSGSTSSFQLVPSRTATLGVLAMAIVARTIAHAANPTIFVLVIGSPACEGSALGNALRELREELL